MIKALLRKLLGERRFHSLRSVKRIASWQERRTAHSWLVRAWAWPRGFRARSAVLYDRAGVEAGNFLDDERHDREAPRLTSVPGLFRHKMLLHSVLSHRGIAHPEIVALVWEFGVIIDVERDAPRHSTAEQVIAQMLSEKKRYIWKPESGGRGEGIWGVELRNDKLVAYRGAREKPFQLSCKRGEVFMLERMIDQHPFWEAFAPACLNTMRIQTLWTPGCAKPFIGWAVQRIGTSETAPTDNWAGGGLLAPVSLASGQIGAAGMKPLPNGTLQPMHAVHPETGVAIRGVVLPSWESIRHFVLALAESFPFEPYVSWDIAMDVTGSPLVVEGNTFPGLDAIQAHGGLLAIPEVREFYVKSGVIADAEPA